jgi:hypothetical protein
LSKLSNHELIDQLTAAGKEVVDQIIEIARFRLPGSNGERKAQQFLSNKLKNYGAENVEQQYFFVRPKFFLWWPRLSLFIFYASILSYYNLPLLSVILAVLSLVNVTFKVLSLELFDYIFPKRLSSNIIAKLKPKTVGDSGKSKRILMLGAHTDSNYEFPIGRKYGMKMAKFAIPVIIIMVYWIISTVVHFIIDLRNSGWGLLRPWTAWNKFLDPDLIFVFGLLCIPYISWFGFRTVNSRPSPGANDDLSGIAVCTQVFKHFAQNPQNRPKYLELWCVCFGSEEGGMKGSKYLAKQVKQAFDTGNFSAESLWVINFDTIAADGPLHITTSAPMYRVKAHDPEVTAFATQSAKNAGIDHILKPNPAGTDSAPFSRLGIPATGILCFPKDGTKVYWHCREDTPENLNLIGIQRSNQFLLQFVQDLDKALGSSEI